MNAIRARRPDGPEHVSDLRDVLHDPAGPARHRYKHTIESVSAQKDFGGIVVDIVLEALCYKQGAIIAIGCTQGDHVQPDVQTMTAAEARQTAVSICVYMPRLCLQASTARLSWARRSCEL